MYPIWYTFSYSTSKILKWLQNEYVVMQQQFYMEKIDNKLAESWSKRYKGCFQYRVLFENEWKGCHPVKTTKNTKCKFHYLPYGKMAL